MIGRAAPTSVLRSVLGWTVFGCAVLSGSCTDGDATAPAPAPGPSRPFTVTVRSLLAEGEPATSKTKSTTPKKPAGKKSAI